MFARHIGASILATHKAGDTGGVDNGPDAAAFGALLHERQLCAEAIERALYIDVHGEVEFGIGDVSDGPALLGDTGPRGPGQIGGACYRLPKVCHSVGDPQPAGLLREHIHHGCEDGGPGKVAGVRFGRSSAPSH